MREVSDDLITKGLWGSRSRWRSCRKGAITAAQQKETRDRLSGTTSFDDLSDCDIIIEQSLKISKRSAKPTSSLTVCVNQNNLRFQHFVNFDYRDDDDDFPGAARALYWTALL